MTEPRAAKEIAMPFLSWLAARQCKRLGFALLAALGFAGSAAWMHSAWGTRGAGELLPVLNPATSEPARLDAEVDGKRAYDFLLEICKLGPRPSGSQALEDHRKLVEEHFQLLGAKVERQQFQTKDPLSRMPVSMVNVIARWHVNQPRRILLAAHYDTRPFPDLDPDPNKRRDPFLGANDGASGVAVLMELAHFLAELDVPYGVDLVLFDGEELVYDERGEYFLGSKHFARQYQRSRPVYQYVSAVVVDMVGDRDLQIYQEHNSLRFAPRLVEQIWETARRLGVKEFVPRLRHEIRDDHLPLNTIANIPACDVIDFDYPAWHTTADTPQQCSAESLEKVAKVLLAWLRQLS